MADRLPRLKPDPIPVIHPVPEYLASGPLQEVYADTKAVLQVPWMGVVTMAFAHYPAFYRTLWGGVRDLAQSEEFIRACAGLRSVAESAAERLGVSKLNATLARSGYAPREIAEIRGVIEVFSHGNMPYLLLATVARLLLEEHPLSETRCCTSCTRRHGPSEVGKLVLMEEHHADAPTRQVFDEIRRTLGLPFVNTDYRALARWPSYFGLAWRDLKVLVERRDYALAVANVHDAAVAAAISLPNPAGLAPDQLIAAARHDASLEEVRNVVRLFQWLLPGLAVNVARFRGQLTGPDDL